MTRPIVWALGTVIAIAVGSSLAGARLSRVGFEERGAALATTTRPDVTAPPAETGTATILSDRRGHFLTEVSIEGRWVKMLVDTGASIVALTSADAAAIGVTPRPGDFRAAISTANGNVFAARARIREIRLGGVVVRDVEAVVMPPGRLDTSLLGMSFLRQLRSFEVDRGRLTLRS